MQTLLAVHVAVNRAVITCAQLDSFQSIVHRIRFYGSMQSIVGTKVVLVENQTMHYKNAMILILYYNVVNL